MRRTLGWIGTLLMVSLFGACGDAPSQTDTLPPEPIADLKIREITETSCVLMWTSPEDPARERVKAFEARIWEPPSTWESGRPLTVGAPGPTGVLQLLYIQDLTPNRVYQVAIRSRDEAENWSALSNILEINPADTTPPAQVTNLEAKPEPRAVTLTFTSPGDDADLGDPTAYEFRYSLTTITPESWAADSLLNQSVKLIGGRNLALRVRGFIPGTRYEFRMRAQDNAGNWGVLSNPAVVTTPLDNVPPGAVKDLLITRFEEGLAALRWTAPGNDGYEGDATEYQVRYNTSPITNNNWRSSKLALIMPAQPQGTPESVVLEGLPKVNDIWFAVFARDDVGNQSLVSNTPKIHIPRDWHVDAKGGADTKTIQEAINRSVDGDRILVAPGTYFENINFRGKAIHVKSTEDFTTTTIYSSFSGASTVTFDSGETRDAILEGFSIRNGRGSVQGTSSKRHGGGIVVFKGSPRILNNRIANNRAAGTAGLGGGIYVGGVLGASNPEIVGNVIEDNTCTGSGGGIAIGTNVTALVKDNIIRRNDASADGGGLWAQTLSGTVTITGNLFDDNVADDHGGGAAIVNGTEGGPHIVEWNVFANNRAEAVGNGDSGSGGGVWIRYEYGTFRNNTVVFNTGLTDGVLSGGGLLFTIPGINLEVSNNLIAFNSEPSVDCHIGGGGPFQNNMLWPESAAVVRCNGSWNQQVLRVDPRLCSSGSTPGAVASDSPALTGATVIGARTEADCAPSGANASSAWRQSRNR